MRIARDLIDPDADKVVRRLARHGFQAYLVGGCVRDLLLARTPKDFDVATNATPKEIRQLFRNCRIIGRRFRLAHIFFGPKIIETSTFRANPREGDEVEEGDEILIRRDNVFGTDTEDARRRDFTINGLFYDLEAERVIDHVGGLEDLERRVVRTIGDPDIRFREDPVRMLRAVKFAARLGFEIEHSTLAALVRHRSEIAKCPQPRVLEELYRLLRGGAARRSLALLIDTGLAGILSPQLTALFGQPPPMPEPERAPAPPPDSRLTRSRPALPGATATASSAATRARGGDEAEWAAVWADDEPEAGADPAASSDEADWGAAPAFDAALSHDHELEDVHDPDEEADVQAELHGGEALGATADESDSARAEADDDGPATAAPTSRAPSMEHAELHGANADAAAPRSDDDDDRLAEDARAAAAAAGDDADDDDDFEDAAAGDADDDDFEDAAAGDADDDDFEDDAAGAAATDAATADDDHTAATAAAADDGDEEDEAEAEDGDDEDDELDDDELGDDDGGFGEDSGRAARGSQPVPAGSGLVSFTRSPEAMARRRVMAWAMLDQLDAVFRHGSELSNSLLLAALCTPFLFEDLLQDGMRPLEANDVVLEVLHPLAQQLQIARRDAERCRQILLAQRRLGPARRRRGKPMSLVRREFFRDALSIHHMMGKVGGFDVSDLSYWSKLHAQDEGTTAAPAGEEMRPGKKRRRRRGGRRRRRSAVNQNQSGEWEPVAGG
ncbi:MAG TPA: polynucleotide adenylyltransferase PcnB [Kofleriaceae bacterium]|nr:polynucleotide adenylyltransferase PcnB [Kofleriaceae bacterium]